MFCSFKFFFYHFFKNRISTVFPFWDSDNKYAILFPWVLSVAHGLISLLFFLFLTIYMFSDLSKKLIFSIVSNLVSNWVFNFSDCIESDSWKKYFHGVGSIPPLSLFLFLSFPSFFLDWQTSWICAILWTI